MTRFGTTALHSAAEYGHAEIVEILIANGADPNAKGDDNFGDGPGYDEGYGYGPIHVAARKGHIGVVQLLRKLGASSPDVEPITDLLADADVDAGETYFGSLSGDSGNCFGCHDIGPQPSKKGGPNLLGTIGNRKASVEGFNYSSAFQLLKGDWTIDELNDFIASPTDHAPGTSMEVPGVGETSMRANLVAYIMQFGDR